jgi:cytochrome P450
MSTTTDLPRYPFAEPPGQPFGLFSDLDRHRFDGPATRVRLPNGSDAWLITRHADVRAMLRSPAFSADAGRPGFPMLRPEPPQRDIDRKGMFIRMDGIDHSRIRRMLTSEFMIKNIRRIEPLIQETVDNALNDLRDAGPPADLVRHFALPVPSMVICHLLGVPYVDHARFQQLSRMLIGLSNPPEEIRAAADELRAYIRSLVEKARDTDPAARGEDLISRLVTERLDTGELDEDELVGIGILLLIAGHETTANMIGLSALLLTQHPEFYAALSADPSLAPGLVEELLRFASIVRSGLPRLALEDVEIGGVTIRAGEGAIAVLSMANRDGAVFGDGEEFDPYRQAQQHIAFGFGVHQCIGQPLARAELRVALVELARRFPALRLAVPVTDLVFRDRAVVFGLTALPVSW